MRGVGAFEGFGTEISDRSEEYGRGDGTIWYSGATDGGVDEMRAYDMPYKHM